MEYCPVLSGVCQDGGKYVYMSTWSCDLCTTINAETTATGAIAFTSRSIKITFPKY